MKALCENSISVCYENSTEFILKGKDNNTEQRIAKDKNPMFAMALIAKWGYVLCPGVIEEELLPAEERAAIKKSEPFLENLQAPWRQDLIKAMRDADTEEILIEEISNESVPVYNTLVKAGLVKWELLEDKNNCRATLTAEGIRVYNSVRDSNG